MIFLHKFLRMLGVFLIGLLWTQIVYLVRAILFRQYAEDPFWAIGFEYIAYVYVLGFFVTLFCGKLFEWIFSKKHKCFLECGLFPLASTFGCYVVGLISIDLVESLLPTFLMLVVVGVPVFVMWEILISGRSPTI